MNSVRFSARILIDNRLSKEKRLQQQAVRQQVVQELLSLGKQQKIPVRVRYDDAYSTCILTDEHVRALHTMETYWATKRTLEGQVGAGTTTLEYPRHAHGLLYNDEALAYSSEALEKLLKQPENFDLARGRGIPFREWVARLVARFWP